jgi:hypothetical protein
MLLFQTLIQVEHILVIECSLQIKMTLKMEWEAI